MKLFSSLPKEVISLIIPYTYQVQDKKLLEDIRHYHISKTHILEFYLKCKKV